MRRTLLLSAAALVLGTAHAQTPTKFNQWYLEGCGNYENRNYVAAGVPDTCWLTVKVTPNGAVPVRAVFTYELEWAQGGKTQKLALPGKDVWTPHGDSDVALDVSNYRYDIALPIHVRARSDRQYTAINVIGNFTFSNGSTKKIFEKIDVVH